MRHPDDYLPPDDWEQYSHDLAELEAAPTSVCRIMLALHRAVESFGSVVITRHDHLHVTIMETLHDAGVDTAPVPPATLPPGEYDSPIPF
jgi:hypothetical protein